MYPFKPGKSPLEVRRTWQLWAKVAVATLPLVFVFKLDDWFEAHFHNSISVAIMLITYGIAFIYLERREQVEPAVTELHKFLIEQLFILDYPSFIAISRNKPFRCYDCRWLDQWC